jgi:ABC-type lipoprotein release transport system permease subunit
MGMVLRQGSRIALWGTLLGLVAAFLLTRLLTSMLPGVAPSEPLVFGLATLGLSLAALVSTWIPARRAATVDPVPVLRTQ